MADPNGNRVGGRWGGLDDITAYRSRDCQEPVWSVFDDKGGGGEGGGCFVYC